MALCLFALHADLMRHNFSSDRRRRPTTAYVDALKTRLDSLEKTLIRLKTSKQEEAAALLIQLRENEDGDDTVWIPKDKPLSNDLMNQVHGSILVVACPFSRRSERRGPVRRGLCM